jgi:hypothetical protein
VTPPVPPDSEAPPPTPVLVVDAANTVGSRPDGWWRDRAGATRRLRDALAAPSLPGPWTSRPEVVLVVEGQARVVEPVPEVAVVAADGSGDDEIVVVVGRLRAQGRPVTVMTSDRGLRARVVALGADVVGPGVLRRG